MKFVKIFCSIYTTIVLLAIYGVLCAVATFIEADASYGTQAAQDLIYRTTYFNIVHFLLMLNLIAVFIYRKMWKSKKYFSIILHVSFIIILFGAALTRFYGFEGIVHIREGSSTNVIITDRDYLNIRVSIEGNVYYTNIPVRYNSVTQTNFHKTLPLNHSNLEVKYNGYTKATKDMPAYLNVHVSYNGESKDLVLPQSYLDANIGETFELGGSFFQFVWGPAEIDVPFEMHLDDFILTRYPGSKSPSSYKSKITVTDYSDNSSFQYEIFMNNVLDYKGYRFFQSSYDNDEQGTILSVNKDPGKIPTYIGYFLLTVGFLLTFFAKNSRIWKLSKYISRQKLYVFFIAFSSFIMLFASNTYAQQDNSSHSSHVLTAPSQADIDNLIKNITDKWGSNSEKAARILVQDTQGRIKPLDTLATDLMHKLVRKDSFKGMSPVEMYLGMMIYSDYFKYVKMFPTSSEELRKILGTPLDEKYVSFADAFDSNGIYKLKDYTEQAYQKDPSHRNKFDKDLIKFDEKMGLAYYTYTAQMFLVFPDVTGKTTGFLTPSAAASMFGEQDKAEIQNILQAYFAGVDNGIMTNNWADADKAVTMLIDYQKAHAADIIPSDGRITIEILMNKYNPFKNLTMVYVLLGIVMFVFVITAIIKNKPVNKTAGRIFIGITIVLVVLHTLALAGRWYIAGYAPWSNAYESMIYIAWAGALAGLLFFKRSLLAVAATNFVAGITLFVANLGFMDPQIGTLVPVLKSYWLNIHVSVITASYSFFTLNLVLGIVSMILFIIRSPKRPHIDQSIINIHCINEISMILGLGLLTVGTFLGGVWANESWGRYWGWDPKETWSLITVIVYTIIVHARLINRFNKPYIFAVLSTVGFYTVLMTYFGVNFYLVGMHSYASGEPVPIPTFLYVMVALHIILIAVSFRKRQLDMPVFKVQDDKQN